MHPVNGDSSASRAAASSHVDARPALIISRRPGTPTPTMGVRDVLHGNQGPRRHRSRLSNAALIGIALTGSVGAVTAVNATLFPSLGHPTTESVWQNPGKVPADSHDPTTPRVDRVMIIDPTAAPVVSVESARGLTTATEPSTTEAAPTTTLEALVASQPEINKPTSGSNSGSGSGTGTAWASTHPIASAPTAAPATPAASGTKSAAATSTSSPDHSSASTDDPTLATAPDSTTHEPDTTAPSNTIGSVPDDTDGGSGGSDDGGSGRRGGGTGSGSGSGNGN